MGASILAAQERKFVDTLSRLAACNPFLPERIELERAALGDAFEDGYPVWSKRVGGANPNVAKLGARLEPLVGKLRSAYASGRRPSPDEERLYPELVYYVLYYRYEDRFERAMGAASVPFYREFASEARAFLQLETLDSRLETEIPHWFAFLFQIRRASHHIFEFIVGSSLPAARLRADIWRSIFTHDLRRYRRALFDRMGDISTLVTGPSGTGKELVARAIGASRYIPFLPKEGRFAVDVDESFFPLNLSALAPTLIESELFGHRRGAFTGALADRKGFFAVCPRLGTVFLDEIGDLDPAIQVKLLRVLQSREFQALGDTKRLLFEGKIVAATNRDLAREMNEGRFRADLYYRLCSDLVVTPSLREQLAHSPSDLEELVRFIARRVVGIDEADGVTDEVLLWIESHLGAGYEWPGNVRELEQCVRNVLIRSEYRPARPRGAEDDWLADARDGRLTAEELLERYCGAVYERTGSYLETARRLGLDRRTVKSRVEACRRRRGKT
jgi:transcriptional regulator with AAA-type ATPase domain